MALSASEDSPSLTHSWRPHFGGILILFAFVCVSIGPMLAAAVGLPALAGRMFFAYPIVLGVAAVILLVDSVRLRRWYLPVECLVAVVLIILFVRRWYFTE